MPRTSTFWIIVAALLVVALASYQWYLDMQSLETWKSQLEAKDYLQTWNAFRTTLIQGVGAAFLAAGLYLTWQQIMNLQKSLHISQEGQFTERFARAIEQLGSEREDRSPKLETRLGAIYALERLAKDARRDHWTIVEILTAYVRENAPRKPDDPKRARQLSTMRIVPPLDRRARPRTDVQAALTVLGRRDRKAEQIAPFRLDLRRTDLSGADLVQGHYEGADFSEALLFETQMRGGYFGGALFMQADLEGANLIETHLQNAMLNVAHLEGASLQFANLTDSDLSGARLQGASLWKANLRKANLSRADLEGANLNEAHLEEATLRDAHLRKALLKETHLEGATLTDAHLEEVQSYGACFDGADLSRAHLNGATLLDARFRGANLSHASLCGSNLARANFDGANLDRADLSAASLRNATGLTRPQLARAMVDDKTVLPESLLPTSGQKHTTQ